MPRILLPTRSNFENILSQFDRSNLLKGNWTDLDLLVNSNTFFEPSGLVFLSAWALKKMEEGRRISIDGDRTVCDYLARMNLFKSLNIKFSEKFSRKSKIGRFIPINLIRNDDDVFETSNSICELILKQIDHADKFLPAVEWAVYEIIDNILRHSETPVPGVVCAQMYPKTNQLNIAIGDVGRGILRSIKESHSVFNHSEAISLAIERGVTRSKDIGQGNGLAGSVEILKLNGGTFKLMSGDIELISKDKIDYVSLPHLDGTIVQLVLMTGNSVELRNTEIAGMGSTDSWNYLHFEIERIENSGGIKVNDECVHVGGRGPAKMLRRKILSLLSHHTEPLILDFVGVEMVSSSFMDELLGRLILEIGLEKFEKELRLINVSEIVEKIANVVIEQRLSDHDKSGRN